MSERDERVKAIATELLVARIAMGQLDVKDKETMKKATAEAVKAARDIYDQAEEFLS